MTITSGCGLLQFITPVQLTACITAPCHRTRMLLSGSKRLVRHAPTLPPAGTNQSQCSTVTTTASTAIPSVTWRPLPLPLPDQGTTENSSCPCTSYNNHNDNKKYAYHELGACDDSLCLPSRFVLSVTMGTCNAHLSLPNQAAQACPGPGRGGQ